MKRDKTFDMAKGIAILLMMYGHLRYAYWNMDAAYCWIYSFHMPFFMYITGVLTNKKEDSRMEQVKNKILKILVPYVIWNFAGFCINWLFHIEEQSIQQFVRGLVFGNDLRGNLPTWYLLAAFWISVFAIFILPFLDTIKKLIAADIVAVILVFLTTYLQQIPDYFRWKGTLMLLPFFITGYLLKKIEFRLPAWLILPLLYIGFKLGRINAVRSWVYVTVGNGTIGIPYLYLLSAICTTIALIELCKYLTAIPKIDIAAIFAVFGRHSLIILCTHWVLGRILEKYMEYGIKMFFFVFMAECVLIGMKELYKRWRQ